jgi:hypothetical protein
LLATSIAILPEMKKRPSGGREGVEQATKVLNTRKINMTRSFGFLPEKQIAFFSDFANWRSVSQSASQYRTFGKMMVRQEAFARLLCKMCKLLVKVSTVVLMQKPFSTFGQRVYGLHECMCQMVLHRNWPKRKRQVTRTWNNIVLNIMNLCNRRKVRVMMALQAAKLRQGEGDLEDVIDEQPVVVKRSTPEKYMQNISK